MSMSNFYRHIGRCATYVFKASNVDPEEGTGSWPYVTKEAGRNSRSTGQAERSVWDVGMRFFASVEQRPSCTDSTRLNGYGTPGYVVPRMDVEQDTGTTTE